MGYSFYGGKQGRTYNLVAHYDSIYQMVLNFRQGGSYNDANYNEYVIIDTYVNRNEKSNRENGIIYRRGLNYAEDFNPNHIPAVDEDTHSFNEETTESKTLWGEIGTVYQDSDEVTTGSSILCEVPRFRHYEYKLVQEDSSSSIVAEVYPKDLIRGDDRVSDRDYVLLKGEPGVRYEDGSGDGSLSISVYVPKYNHYSYVLNNVQGVVKADISVGKEKEGIQIPDTMFNTQWSAFVTNPGGGAVYVGQIVGPEGASPEVQMTDWETFEKEYLQNPNIIANKGSDKLFSRPGYEDGIRYNDDMQYGWATVKDAQGNVNYAIISLDIPYTVFRYRADSVSAYGPTVEEVEVLPEYPSDIDTYYYVIDEDEYYIWDETNTVDTIEEKIESIDDLPSGRNADIQKYYQVQTDEEFYHYEPQLPVYFVEELPLEEEVDVDSYYYLENVWEDYDIGYYSWDNDLQEWLSISVIDLYVLVSDVPDFLTKPAFVKTEIWSVSFNEEENKWYYSNILRERAISQGHNFFKDYEIKIPKGIKGTSISEVEVNDNFDLQYKETVYDVYDEELTPEQNEKGKTSEFIKLCTLRVIQSTETIEGTETNPLSYIRINYYHDEEIDEDYQNIPFKRIIKCRLDTSTGNLYVDYMNGNSGTTQHIGTLTWIDSTITNPISFNENKQLVVKYNNKTDILPEQLRTVTKIEKENDKQLDLTKRFYYDYDADNLTPESGEPANHYEMSEPINEIVAVKLYGDNIAVLYSDPIYRQGLSKGENYYLIPYEENADWTYTNPDVRQGDLELFYWKNIGPILSGQHVFGKFVDIDELKNNYPYGFGKDQQGDPEVSEINHSGWVGSVIEVEGGQVIKAIMYAYDYNDPRSTSSDPDTAAECWYEISSLSVDGFDPETMMLVQPESTINPGRPASKDGGLVINGYWFVVEDIETIGG